MGEKMALNDPVVSKMQELIQRWEAAADQRLIFLSCYRMMTSNMLEAIERDEFIDSLWVEHLLHRFAAYYFMALEAYEIDAPAAPPVWKLAFDAAVHPGTMVLQNLMLGVNAHINYDLVLALNDLLKPEWALLSEDQRKQRYTDHCRVNEVIGRTIDAVQDQVLEPGRPLLDIIDKLLGPLDEAMISGLISHWRDSVWKHATRLAETGDPGEQADLIRQVEHDALKMGNLIVF